MGPRERELREFHRSDIQANALAEARREDHRELWRQARMITSEGSPQANELSKG
jgi:hypothetical protein